MYRFALPVLGFFIGVGFLTAQDLHSFFFGNPLNTQQAQVQVAASAGEAPPNWIWLDRKAHPGQVVFFRKRFQAPGKIKKAKLYATCDDEMIVFLNGQRILRGESWQNPAFADVTNSVGEGENVLAIRGKNRQSTIAALLAKLVIETADGKKLIVRTDATWRVAPKAKKSWKALGFEDNAWTRATVLGKLGDGPWLAVNKTSLTSAAKQDQPATFLKNLIVKKDFKVEQIYVVPRSQGSWVSMTVGPKGRLFVSDQYGKLYRVTPPALGEKAGEMKVEPIDVELGEAQGLLWAFDSLYVSVNRGGKYQSGLYRVRDTDNDGKLDKVVMLRGLRGGGEHGPHAVMLSPDKKSLFVVCGNHTDLTKLSGSYVPRIWAEDSLLPRMWDANGHARGRMAPAGCIYKVDPAGINWELWCCGFRNQYDAAFNRNGELFTYDSDMEWDMNTPWYRPTRVCHCISGAEFGWRGGTAKFPTYYPDNLPPVVDIGPGSPTGVAFGYGAKFPAKYQDAFFICDWSYGKLYAVHLTPVGASYKGDAEEFIAGTPLPLTDIVVNPNDGAMYFAVGGRRVKSALYRVTYTGKESTAPSKGTTKGAEARRLRLSLEAYHNKKDPKAISAAWPYLGHSDRFIRWAARTAVEHQEPKLWQEKALNEKSPQAALEALLALVRAGDKSLQPQILNVLYDRLDWKNMPEAQKLAWLRICGLAFARMGPAADAVRERFAARLDRYYPAKSRELNDELAKVLIYLQSPNAAAKTLALMRNAVTQEEQMAFALSLRNLKNGWNMMQRKEYFAWFPKAFGYKGGNSFHGFVRNIRSEAVANLTPKEKKILGPILTAKPVVKNPFPVKARPFVKEWKMSEIANLLSNRGLKNRDFNRGRTMFAATRCFACHRFANEGGAAGPDLTGVSGRFSPHDLAESIVEPSKTVSDQYQAVTIVTRGGQIVTGRIVNLNGDSLRVNTDMYDPNKLAGVNRRQIVSMTPAKLSMMPTGLIDTLNEQEILDLLAYLLSRGDRNHAMFRRQE